MAVSENALEASIVVGGVSNFIVLCPLSELLVLELPSAICSAVRLESPHCLHPTEADFSAAGTTFSLSSIPCLGQASNARNGLQFPGFQRYR